MARAGFVILILIYLIAAILPATVNALAMGGDQAPATITPVVNSTDPVRIELKVERAHVITDDLDNIRITAYVYDALDNPIADGTRINFTIGNAESNAFTGGFTWSINNGSFSEPPGTGTFTSVTKDGAGSTNVQFGWVPDGFLGGVNSIIWAYINGTNIHAATKIYFTAPMAAWAGYVVDSSGAGIGGINVKLHVMGYYSNWTPYEIYNMTKTTSSSQPFVGHFAFDYIVLTGSAYAYVDAEARSPDNETIYGKSGNLSMNRSAVEIGNIVLMPIATASPSATARPTPGFEVLLVLACIACLAVRPKL